MLRSAVTTHDSLRVHFIAERLSLPKLRLASLISHPSLLRMSSHHCSVWLFVGLYLSVLTTKKYTNNVSYVLFYSQGSYMWKYRFERKRKRYRLVKSFPMSFGNRTAWSVNVSYLDAVFHWNTTDLLMLISGKNRKKGKKFKREKRLTRRRPSSRKERQAFHY